MRLTVYDHKSLEEAIEEIKRSFARFGCLKIDTSDNSQRSLNQNAISHLFYQQIANELPEDDATGWKSYCKLHHGVPILRTEDDEFRAFYDEAIKGMSYEHKLAAMKFTPVTSLMTKSQLSKYLEAVKDDFYRRGVILEFPMEHR